MTEGIRADNGAAGGQKPIDEPASAQEPEKTEQKPRAPQDTCKEKSRALIARFLIKLILAAALLTVVFIFIIGVHIQRGNRMYPFLMDGDMTVFYRLGEYRVGDVVAYKNPDNGEIALSRIAAMGENTIQVTPNGKLLIDDQELDESVFYPTYQIENSAVNYPYTMRKNGVFVLDDCRTIGSDSRSFGELRLSDLIGKVVYVFRRRGI